MIPFDWGPLLQGGPLFIGILNLTPDSFSDGGRFLGPEAALAQARRLVAGGAGLLDLGAESTRPGALPVSEAEEWARLAPGLVLLRAELPGTPLSVDTRHPGVAARALGAGATVLNDVTGFSDPGMRRLARDRGCGCIAMRSRLREGRLWMPPYEDPAPGDAVPLVEELREVKDRLLAEGVAEQRLLLDPGFGFGTRFTEDLALWEALPELPRHLDWPAERFCLGISRKRFVAWKSGDTALPAAARDEATAALHREAMDGGYRVFRTHAVPGI
ncbi:MAG: dihydropteroate synthase [Acidobacteria bacterium]|nr:dihydropteroate synthase [Acidobacteriota bacterium]